MGMEDLFQTQAVAISAGGAQATSGTVIFSNSNSISFGLAGQTLTASFNSPAGAPFAISAGGASVSSGTVVFSNSNGVTFGLNGSTVTASVNAGGNFNISAGTTSNNLTNVVFSNSNNISFGLNASTVTASASIVPPNISLWQNMSGYMFQASTFTTFSVMPLNPEIFPGRLTANTFLVGINGAGSQSTASGSILFSFGIYTYNNQTLSLQNSAATSITYAAVTNNSTAFSGFRWLTLHSSQWSIQPVLTQTNYWIGYLVSSSNATQSINLVGQNYLNAEGRFGTAGVSAGSSARSYLWTPFMGAYTTSTGALPASINISDLDAALTSVGNFVPHVILNNLVASF